MSQLRHHQILVAIETDPTRYHGEHPVRPHELTSSDAGQLLAHVAADLSQLIPEVRNCSLCLAGTLHDQTRVLRPHFPIFSELEMLAESHYENRDFEPSLISFGTEMGQLPSPVLEPDHDAPLGLLLVLPMILSGAPDRVGPIAETSEHLFMESGQLSANTSQSLETLFGVSVNHARLMTLTDLQAMLHLQLENFGFEPLAELIDAALANHELPLDVTTSAGHAFEFRDGKVFGHFESFDHWAAMGRGKFLPPERQTLAGGYADWTREYRQYLTTLEAHDVEFETVFYAGPGAERHGNYIIEHSEAVPPEGAAAVTEHSVGDLGTVAVTVVSKGAQENYYPLTPGGINEIQTFIGEQGFATGGTAFPGGICHDAESRRLVPDLLTPGPGQ